MNLYPRLFLLLTFSHFKKHYIKVILAVAGMATGIAIFVTTDIYKETIYEDVKEKEQQLLQSDKWLIKSTNGRISSGHVRKIAALGLFHDISPGSARLEYIEANGESVLARFAGIDVLSGQQIIAQQLFSSETEQGTMPALGSRFFDKGETVRFKRNISNPQIKILEIINQSSEDSPLVVTDISLYQSVFSDSGWVDRLEVSPAADVTRIEKSLKEIDPSLKLTTHSQNIDNKQSLSDAFLVNLQFFSLISLIISLLLIYQFYRFILLDRERDFAKLRAVGIRASQLRTVLLVEITVLGLLSSAAGIVAGFIFSRYSMSIVTATVNTFYFSVSSDEILLSGDTVITGIVLGIAGCLVSGIHPALNLIRSATPLNFLGYKNSGKERSYNGLLCISGIIVLIVLFSVINPDFQRSRFIVSVVSVFVFVAGVSMTIPYIVRSINSGIIGSRKTSALSVKTAASYINRTLIRQSVFILSLAILVGFVISLIIFVSSFRLTVDNWISQVTPADLYIQSEFNNIKTPFPLPAGIEEYIDSHPLVKKYDTITKYDYEYIDIPVQIRASDFTILNSKRRLGFKSLREDTGRIDEDKVLVSEPFQSRFNKSTGDTITIIGDKQTITLEIAGVFYDYITEKGAIYLDKEMAGKIFTKNEINGISVYGLTDQERLELENDINKNFKSSNIRIEDQQQIRENTLSLFDRTFRIVWLLAGLAVFISIVTIFNATIMVYLERLEELTQLRAVGASTAQLISVIWSQMSLLCICTLIFSFLFSAGFLSIITKINELFFGWTIHIVFDWKPYVLSILVIFILARLAVHFTFSHNRNNIDMNILSNE